MGERVGRRPKNGPEGAFWDAAVAAGWFPTKRGWPDFACFSADGELICVEVKPEKNNPSKWQQPVLQALANAGIRCYVWRPDTGFVRVKAAPP